MKKLVSILLINLFSCNVDESPDASDAADTVESEEETRTGCWPNSNKECTCNYKIERYCCSHTGDVYACGSYWSQIHDVNCSEYPYSEANTEICYFLK